MTAGEICGVFNVATLPRRAQRLGRRRLSILRDAG